nr:hypothetical protein [Ardenticatenales bacterium]
MGRKRILLLLLLLLLLSACGGREELASEVESSPTTARGAFPRHVGAGQVVSAWDSPHFDMQVLGAETDSAQRLTVHLALYN